MGLHSKLWFAVDNRRCMVRNDGGVVVGKHWQRREGHHDCVRLPRPPDNFKHADYSELYFYPQPRSMFNSSPRLRGILESFPGI